MLLPFREHLDFGPTPYDLLQAREGIPIVKGNVVSDVTTLELGKWERMGASGCYLNLSHQQQHPGIEFQRWSSRTSFLFQSARRRRESHQH